MKHVVLPPLWKTTKTTTRDQIISLVFFLSAIVVIDGSITTNFLVESFATNNSNISSKRQINYNRSTAAAPKNFHGYHASAIISSVTRCDMVRNIDLVEALIFYGTASMVSMDEEEKGAITTHKYLPGVENLLEECQRDDTFVIAILDHERDLAEMMTESNNSNRASTIHFRTMTSPPPNPLDLWESIHSIEIQPKGFGGSSGFGRKAADPERPPAPSRCVVLCDTLQKCRAARSAGMRVLCLTDNELADGVINFGIHNDEDDNGSNNNNLEYYWESITMDDIATPGSFWLNPPLPKDDEGNGVNIYSVIQSFESSSSNNNNDAHQQQQEDYNNVDEDDNENLEAILMDMDPL